MVEKLHNYQGPYGRLRHLRDKTLEKFEEWKEDNPRGVKGIVMDILNPSPRSKGPPRLREESLDDFDHIYRRKTRGELIRISAAVMGIEFSYAAETAFVSPTLLKIGVQHQHMTMVWGLSPLLGFLITPILGSLSDGCKLAIGRRRPFILLLALGVLCGLILIPNGEEFGHSLGDFYPSRDLLNTTSRFPGKSRLTWPRNRTFVAESDAKYPHPWGIFFTVLGTVLLDFDADSCQSPARAYLLDISVPEDHARGLSTFTIMAGLGGFLGYALGGVNWDATTIGQTLGGHVRTVFTFTTVLFLVCIIFTVTSFKEIPLNLLQKHKAKHMKKLAQATEGLNLSGVHLTYGTANETSSVLPIVQETELNGGITSTMGNIEGGLKEEPEQEMPSLKEYLWSIVFMPKSLRMVCLTNLFCWMSHVCYSLYFTDFVGEAVFHGDPSAPLHSKEYKLYEEGVRFGCWGMSMYSLSCSCYSLIIETLIKRFRAKNVYVGGLLFYSIGMMLLAITKDKLSVILFSWTAGVMYSTLFTMPYLLVARYHSNGVFELTKDGEVKVEARQRGLGTDVGIVSSMVFLAQFTLALGMGEVVMWTGTTTAVVGLASILAFCGALTATRVMYLDL
ncbi:hypothetical protein RUM43_011318 [Polyplax serrata]|uniref:Proton-associated sugar transporter A n=1 Tax=Polyplax serrata TaxID=468196 RepID=A0AAN8S068_POLSC